MPIRYLFALLPFLLAATPAPPASPTAAPGLLGVRVQADANAAELTLQLPAAVPFQARSDDQGWTLSLPGLSAGVGAPPFHDPVLTGFTADADAAGLTLHLNWAYWCPTTITPSADGRTLTVDFQKVYRDEQDETLAPGVVHAHIREADENGPLNIHVLRVDVHQPGVRLAPALSRKGFFGREPVEAMLAETGAIAGVNGSYFSLKTGEPAGLLMLDGRVIASPYADRAALAITAAGQLYIGNTDLASRLVLPGGQSYDFDGVNKPCGLNRMVLYNSAYGAPVTAAAGMREFALQADGTVCSIEDASCPVPADGYVIAAQGQPAEWLSRYVKPGTRLQLQTPLTAYWPDARDALGGGPLLVRRGQTQIDAVAESFGSDITAGLAPRTAVGVTADGTALLVTVDGRQPHISRGLSLAGLAALMQQLGATDAMNLDGGGSTTMAIAEGGLPQVVNHPSDGYARYVNNGLLVFVDRAH